MSGGGALLADVMMVLVTQPELPMYDHIKKFLTIRAYQL